MSTWWDTAVLAGAGLAVAGRDLGSPRSLVFDEIYYVSDAYGHLASGVGVSFQAHPPLGTWLVAAGTALSRSPVGWRLASLLLGAVCVALIHRLALRTLPSGSHQRLAAAAAAVLVIADGSWLVLSRAALLDGPLTTFVIAAVACTTVAVDKHRQQSSVPWLAAAGLCLGAAAAVKWSGALALVPLVAVLLTRRREASTPPAAALGIVLLTAATVYSAAWVPFALTRDDVAVTSCPTFIAPCPTDGGVDGVVAQHIMQLRYHSTLRVESPLSTPPDYWPLMREPSALYRADCRPPNTPVPDPLLLDPTCPDDLPAGTDTIVYIGNPVLWLGYLALLPFAVDATRRHNRAALISVVAWIGLWTPWLLAPRTSYIYYMAPVVPFMALGLAASAVAIPTADLRPVLLRSAGGASIGAGLAAATPITGAAAIIGWAVGALTRHGRRPLADPVAGLAAGRITVLLATAATITAVIMHSTWTAN